MIKIKILITLCLWSISLHSMELTSETRYEPCEPKRGADPSAYNNLLLHNGIVVVKCHFINHVKFKPVNSDLLLIRNPDDNTYYAKEEVPVLSSTRPINYGTQFITLYLRKLEENQRV